MSTTSSKITQQYNRQQLQHRPGNNANEGNKKKNSSLFSGSSNQKPTSLFRESITQLGIDPNSLSKDLTKRVKPFFNKLNKGPDNVHLFTELTSLAAIKYLMGLDGLIFKAIKKPNEIELKCLVPKTDTEGIKKDTYTEVYAFYFTPVMFNILKVFNALNKVRLI